MHFNRDFLLLSCVRACRLGIPTGPTWALSDQRQISPRCKMATPEQWCTPNVCDVPVVIVFNSFDIVCVCV